jgi:hypothetical protein
VVVGQIFDRSFWNEAELMLYFQPRREAREGLLSLGMVSMHGRLGHMCLPEPINFGLLTMDMIQDVCTYSSVIGSGLCFSYCSVPT